MDLTIRRVTPADYYATEVLTREAFWNIFRHGCDEHLMVSQIRSSADYIPKLDYMAEVDGRAAGHILYSKARVIDGAGGEHALIAFGPLSVLPELQKKGIGGALIEHTKKAAKGLGYRAIGIHGYPSYYPRFGFRNAKEFGITAPDGKNHESFMMLPLYEGSLNGLTGRFYESDAFNTTPEALEEFEKRFPSKGKHSQAQP